VELDLDGTRYVGSYSVENDVVTVVYGLSKKGTQVGDSSTERIAKMLLRELVEESFRGTR
jgi:hypothetical protein